MDKFEPDFLLSMARSLDARAERLYNGSYMRKLLKEQAAKFREAASHR
jgi:hypothetical protein